MLIKIVSGGQTGVDQAALEAARLLGIDFGGYCVKGGKDENGQSILNFYPSFKESRSEDPAERTKLNIENSDGTLIVVPKLPLPDHIKDGTLLTISHSKNIKKPMLIISLEDLNNKEKVIHWISSHHISILNCAGPRESSCPDIYKNSLQLLSHYFAY